MDQKHVILGLVASFLILIGGVVVFSSSQSASSNEGVVLAEKVKGNAESTVVLAEYSDFQCPACAGFGPTLKELMDKHGDKIRFEYHHFPLIQIHQNAATAAQAAEAAGVQGKFWEMHDMLFERQSAWSSSISARGMFISYAEELGLDTEQFERHLNATIIRDQVRAELRDAQSLGLTGTPSFFLNGEKMVIETYADFINQVEVALGVADRSGEAQAAPQVEFGF